MQMPTSHTYVPRHRASTPAARRSRSPVLVSRRYVPRHGGSSRRSAPKRVSRTVTGRHARSRPSAVSARQVVLTLVAVLMAVPALASLGGPTVRAAMQVSTSEVDVSVLADAPVPLAPRVVGPVPVVPGVAAEPAANTPAVPGAKTQEPSPVPTAGAPMPEPSVTASEVPEPAVSETAVPTRSPSADPSPEREVPDTKPSGGTAEFSGVPMAVTGDSIAVMLAEAWPGKVPVVEAQVGISSSASARVLVPLLESLDDSGLTVVALGTNDDASSSAAFAETVRKVVAAAPGCVAWLTVHREQGGQTWESFNEVLRSSERSFRRLVLVDWDALASSTPEAVYPDGIHPTPSGVRQLADMVAQAALSCPST